MSKTARRQFAFVLLLTLFAAAERPALAAGDASDPTRQLQNLVYYPHAREFLVTPQFTASLKDSGATDNAAGSETSSSKTTFYQASLNLTYGVFDRLRLGFAETELLDQTTKTTTDSNGNQTAAQSRGPSDPTIVGAYRFVESPSCGMYADVLPAFTVPFGVRLNGTNHTGNDLSGAWTSSLSVPLYWLHGMNELGVTPMLGRNFGSRTNGNSLVNSTAGSAYWTESFSFQDRMHLTNSFYLQPGLTLNFHYAYQTENLATAVETPHAVAFYITPALIVGYLVNDHFLLEGTGSYSNNTNSAAPASGRDTDAANTSTVASLRARFTF